MLQSVGGDGRSGDLPDDSAFDQVEGARRVEGAGTGAPGQAATSRYAAPPGRQPALRSPGVSAARSRSFSRPPAARTFQRACGGFPGPAAPGAPSRPTTRTSPPSRLVPTSRALPVPSALPRRDLREHPDRPGVVDGDEGAGAVPGGRVEEEDERGGLRPQPENRVPASNGRPSEVDPGPSRAPVVRERPPAARRHRQLLPRRSAVGAEEERGRSPAVRLPAGSASVSASIRRAPSAPGRAATARNQASSPPSAGRPAPRGRPTRRGRRAARRATRTREARPRRARRPVPRTVRDPIR